jgi:hypothetical protein
MESASSLETLVALYQNTRWHIPKLVQSSRHNPLLCYSVQLWRFPNEKLVKVRILLSPCQYVCPSACNNSRTTELSFMKFDAGKFYCKFLVTISKQRTLHNRAFNTSTSLRIQGWNSPATLQGLRKDISVPTWNIPVKTSTHFMYRRYAGGQRIT